MIENGILNINKPAGITSHGCVAKVRKLLGIKRVGHTGTLDPMAEGVLPVCFGNAVRIMEYLDMDLKKYKCEMRLGITTETQDIWGEVIEENSDVDFTYEQAKAAVESFKGLIQQTPPKYSALKVAGKKLYEYARAGLDVEIKKREVFIEDILMTSADPANLTISFEVTCSKGTYIRTICQDIGEKLGTGGAMSRLIRLGSGAFVIEDAVPLDDLDDLTYGEIEKLIKPTDYPLVHFGRLEVKDKEIAECFINGRALGPDEVLKTAEPKFKETYNVYAKTSSGRVFLGVAFYDEENETYKADKVFFGRQSNEII